ncbi:MAG: phosphoribosyltransferase family protein [Flavobacteriaceae bacterium]|nr:phosphoribosyltransferase family protein [Flavobacteriaceae bacterium]
MLQQLINFCFPRSCVHCEVLLPGKMEYLCTRCLCELPLTPFAGRDSEELKRVFYGKLAVEHVTGLLFYEKEGITHDLIHHLKYRSMPNIGAFLGTALGERLNTYEYWQNVDYILPVPLSFRRKLSRGYNQVAPFAKALAKALNSNYDDTHLVKIKHLKPQARKSREARSMSLPDAYLLKNPERFKGKHLMLVDDILTTGNTLIACGRAIKKVLPESRLSIASIAITR